jgi:nitrogen fixation/metabolism regulation signal transduction histidine kinase
MHRLRNRLIAAFLAATVLPLAATFWITTSLLDRSLGYATTDEVARLSRTLEATVRQFYQRERDAVKADATAGRAAPVVYDTARQADWPEPVRAFWASGERERFGVAGSAGDKIEYLRRRDAAAGIAPGIDAYQRDLGGIRMDQLTAELRQTRQLVEAIDSRDLRRGFRLTLLLLLAATWIAGLVPLILIAHRVSRPIQQLTAALTDVAAGDASRRIDTGRDRDGAARDEVGRAVDAFNRMAGQLQQSRERLVHLTRMASWQSLARKTAHEIKNSLTPIRLTVEEMQARQPVDRAFMDQAVQIVVSEIESLERRVRAFSEFSSEPPVTRELLDVNALVAERVSLLRPAHPATRYDLRLDPRSPRVEAGADLVKGILTNLLQNAAEAAGAGGTVLATTSADDRQVVIEVHDSGPGLNADAAATLFEPTITFKKYGMGLGLSIARSHALLSGGDIALVPGTLGGAAFRVTLPAVAVPVVHEAAS